MELAEIASSHPANVRLAPTLPQTEPGVAVADKIEFTSTRSAVQSACGVRVVELPGLGASKAPQSAHRENDGEERGHAQREEGPDEE